MPRVPEPLGAGHDVGHFDCGAESLNRWLRRRAVANQAGGASRTFVACEGTTVVAYCALASGAVARGAAPGRVRRNRPDPVPVVVLARLAVAATRQGQGLGRALFQDAAQGVVHAAEAIGIPALIVHALSNPARDVYLGLGLEPAPLDPMTLMLTVQDLREAQHEQALLP